MKYKHTTDNTKGIDWRLRPRRRFIRVSWIFISPEAFQKYKIISNKKNIIHKYSFNAVI